MNKVSIVPRSKKQILRELSISKNALVLEIGSGDNPNPRSDVLSDKYLGYTPDREGREIGIDRRPFVACDGQQLPFKDKSFDYIIASQTLEYIDDPDKFLKELTRVGKRGYIEVASEIREVLFDWDARKYMASVNQQGRLIIRRKLGRSPFGSVFRKLQDHWLNAFIGNNWSVFNYTLEWEGSIDYIIDEDGIEVTKLQKELEIELKDARTQQGKYTNWLRATWTLIPNFIRQPVRLVRRATKLRNRRRVMSLEALFRIMACPVCRGDIKPIIEQGLIVCLSCKKSYLYPYINKHKKRIPIMLAEEPTRQE